MPSKLRKIRSFSLDPTVLSELERTKGSVSASERVNQLLKQGLEMERKANLYQEAAIFFRSAPDDRDERRAFQKANVRSWARKWRRGKEGEVGVRRILGVLSLAKKYGAAAVDEACAAALEMGVQEYRFVRRDPQATTPFISAAATCRMRPILKSSHERRRRSNPNLCRYGFWHLTDFAQRRKAIRHSASAWT
jgi:hypothetical protein